MAQCRYVIITELSDPRINSCFSSSAVLERQLLRYTYKQYSTRDAWGLHGCEDTSYGLWVVTPCSDVAGYQRFGRPCCLHLQDEVKWTWRQKVFRNFGVLPHHYSSVGIALGCELDDRGFRVRFPAGPGNISHHRVQNGSGAHPASYPMGTRGSFPGGKAAGAWSWPL
jgi:hypothetical protein